MSKELKNLERGMISKFKELCEEVRTDPSAGNSSKSKKDNFLDGAEIMLTEFQYQLSRMADSTPTKDTSAAIVAALEELKENVTDHYYDGRKAWRGLDERTIDAAIAQHKEGMK